jgi:hypothetical protein
LTERDALSTDLGRASLLLKVANQKNERLGAFLVSREINPEASLL